MNKSNCEQCGIEVIRRGQKPARFCSIQCKADWQKTQKPVDEAWLRQKYLVEKLSTYAIGKIVNRNPKQVYEWLLGYGIPTRKRLWDTTPADSPRRRKNTEPPNPYRNKEWLIREYVERQRPANDIAKEFGVTGANVYYFLKKFGIACRDMATIRKAKHWGASGESNPMYGKTGENNPNYKGGSSPERQRLYASMEWKDAASVAYKRDDYRCQRCGIGRKGFKSIQLHHIKPWASNPEIRFNPDNLVTLCKDCHSWVHSADNIEKDFIE